VKYLWKHKKTSNSQSNSEQKVQCWRHHNTWLQTILQSHNNKKQHGISTKTDRKTNGSEDPDINPHIYSQMIFDKVAQNTQWTKDSLFNKCWWENWISTYRRLKLDPCLFPVPKSIQSGSKTLI
jgi:hypothetical protein